MGYLPELLLFGGGGEVDGLSTLITAPNRLSQEVPACILPWCTWAYMPSKFSHFVFVRGDCWEILWGRKLMTLHTMLLFEVYILGCSALPSTVAIPGIVMYFDRGSLKKLNFQLLLGWGASQGATNMPSRSIGLKDCLWYNEDARC